MERVLPKIKKTAEPASFVKIVEEKVKKSDCFMQSYAVK